MDSACSSETLSHCIALTQVFYRKEATRIAACQESGKGFVTAECALPGSCWIPLTHISIFTGLELRRTYDSFQDICLLTGSWLYLKLAGTAR